MTDQLIAMLPYLAHQAVFGAIAAAGFGVLFNFGWRSLAWCAVAGALALGIRTFSQKHGASLEAATFLAAIGTSCIAILGRRWLGVACHAIALAGCIPMVPGAFFGQALLGYMAVAADTSGQSVAQLVASAQAFIRVVSIVGAIGAGLAIPAYLLRSRQF
ncbi:MAG: threonine/serine exporter family protein [Rhodopseudomonas palustris]|uniref:Threonine/serine exporter family protein n=1 Tax=Rhodopseudomonas palustris TaxID=1076 RepID=A0A933S3F1_RHOPL|nr:threonine/serine exporter family protein [Rhodopseudomonas palustris]